MKALLVTGGAGFIGSNLVSHLVHTYPDYQIINLDLLTYAGNQENLKDVEKASNYLFVHGSISDRDLIERIFQHYYIHGIINLAAESHVDNSIKQPDVFVETNVKGTFTLLDVAYKYWMEKPFVFKSGFEDSVFLQVSTDEVFGSLGASGYFTEESPYQPNSPYSASKAGADMLVRSYHHTYGMKTIITNCSNNFGPKQHDEKLIPTIIRKALAGEAIPIYGDGSNVRDWLFVTDHCKGIDLAYHKGTPGEMYVIGGGNERSNNTIADVICRQLDQKVPKATGSYREQLTFVEDRAGHDFRYAINAAKITHELGWKQHTDFESALSTTIDFYIQKYQS